MSLGNDYNKRGIVTTSTYNTSSLLVFKKEIIYIYMGRKCAKI